MPWDGVSHLRRTTTDGKSWLLPDRIDQGLPVPAERALTAEVASAAPDALDLLVTVGTGPVHLAGFVGAPTVSSWGSSDLHEARQTGARDFRVTGADVPCKPCCRNQCHRNGAGTLLSDSREESMKLISVDQARAAAERALTEVAP
jgi:ADP-heptose:LPS heptosyltransferase